MSSARTQQTATEDLFKAVSEHTAEVPVIVVATKMDNFRGIKREQAREEYEPTTYEASPEERVQLDKKYTEYAADEIGKRIDLIEREIQSLDEGHFDACIAVARSESIQSFTMYGSLSMAIDDKSSIERLNQVTLENVKDERLQLLYIATQTAGTNLKINAATGEIMKIYRRVLGTASSLSCLPMASSINRTTSAISICKSIIHCFGLPTVNHDTIFEIVKSIVWDDAGHNVSIIFSEAAATLAMIATVAGGGLPFFLAAGAFNFPLVVPATTRLILMLASDLILILVRAFKITTTTCVGQPGEKDVARAARDYRLISKDVHREVFKLVPKTKTNVVKSFRYSKVRLGFEKVIEKFKEEVTKDLSTSQPRCGHHNNGLASDTTIVDREMEDMKKIFPQATVELSAKTKQIEDTITAKMSLEISESEESDD